MKNILQLVVILGLAFILTGCPPKETAPPSAEETAPPSAEDKKASMTLDDLDEDEKLSDAQRLEDEKAKKAAEQRKKLIKELAVKDLAEKKELLVKKKKVEEVIAELKEEISKVLKKRAEKKAKRLFKEKVAGKIKKDSKLSAEEIEELIVKAATGELTVKELKEVLIKKLGVSKEEVEKIIKEARAEGKKLGLDEEEVKQLIKEKLLAKVLEETTTLTKEEIAEVVKETSKIVKETKELAKKLAAATSAEEVRKILEEAGDVSEEDIASIAKKVEEVVAQEKNFLSETLAKLYARLQRDRRLEIEDAFCRDIEGILDHLLISPSYFDTDRSNIDGYVDEINRNHELLIPILVDYQDITIQLEGNTDIRASNDYNKALGERRWKTPIKLLTTLYTLQGDIPVLGVSRGEECQMERTSGESQEDWWTRNRRTDYMFKLQ